MNEISEKYDKLKDSRFQHPEDLADEDKAVCFISADYEGSAEVSFAEWTQGKCFVLKLIKDDLNSDV